jgi:hypothetical protein
MKGTVVDTNHEQPGAGAVDAVSVGPLQVRPNRLTNDQMQQLVTVIRNWPDLLVSATGVMRRIDSERRNGHLPLDFPVKLRNVETALRHIAAGGSAPASQTAKPDINEGCLKAVLEAVCILFNFLEQEPPANFSSAVMHMARNDPRFKRCVENIYSGSKIKTADDLI